jgi:hypothetical protein
MGKVRSRNYPSMSLGAAIERARELYKREGRAKVPASVVVSAWGYNSLNGASLRALAALRQYGLLDGGLEDTRLSDRALTLLLEPDTSPDYAVALREALTEPNLFHELLDEYKDNLPSDGALFSYLVRKQGFGESAAKTLIQAFRESVELVGSIGTPYITPMAHVNATDVRPAEEPAKIMSIKEIETVKLDSPLEYSFGLSKNTAVSVRVSGRMPTPAQLKNLSQWLEVVKSQIEMAVHEAEEEAVLDRADYTVT